MSTAEAYAERLLAASMSTYETFAVYVGLQLGWFAALADRPQTSSELADRTGTQERYCREFCELLASVGTLTVEPGSTAADRRFALPPGPAEVLLDTDSLNHLGPLAQLAVAAGRRIDDLLAAYRNGGGVSWADLRRRRSRVAGRAQPAVVQPPARSGAGRGPRPTCRPEPPGCPDRRHRLRRWLVDPRPGSRLPAGEVGGHRRRRPFHRCGSNSSVGGRAGRPGAVHRGGWRDLGHGRALRRGLRLRVPARHAAPSRGTVGDPLQRPGRRPGGDHGRGGRRRVHRTWQRDRPVHVRLQPVHLLARRALLYAFGGHRHRDEATGARPTTPPAPASTR